MPFATFNNPGQAEAVDQNGNALFPVTAPVVVSAVNAVTVCKATAGRLFKVTVTVLGTAAVSFFDNAAAASGTLLFVVPANAAVGTVYDLTSIPFANGLTASASATNPGLTVAVA